MCIAITYQTKNHYFGRNLDVAKAYHETVTIIPRNYPFHFRKVHSLERHYAMIGMAFVSEDYPLYYDAVNEKGLAMAGLNFPENAVYNKKDNQCDNIAPFEFIPWILGQCVTVKEAKIYLERMNMADIPFSEELPLSPLHWMIADKNEAITVEVIKDGLKVYSNPVGVLSNNPPFDFMMQYLSHFRNLSAKPSVNFFSEEVDIPIYCQGMAAIGLPGDYSSASRFVKAAFVKLNSVCGTSEEESVSQFFHILSSVEMPRGCVALEKEVVDFTIYSSCMNQDRGIYYYMTYDNHQIYAVDMYREDLEAKELKSYPLQKRSEFYLQN